ncbi:glycine cleavage system protein R [Thalassotalea atypica]|uniref:glycine cleavage system protein R n=1 Tax=Thalassotalea atypica TaxID=2054316 RepID=UPI0025723330|nr:ACT domain-containing protein [Thalassotalea atypica]
MNHLVITFIGPDRPGVVDTFSNIVKQNNGNWQTSSMHHLSGFFAGIFEVAIEASNTENLSSELQSIEGYTVHIEKAVTSASQKADIVLELTANDRSGIIQDISSVIHHQGGNLLKLVSAQENAAHSGQLMFKAKAQIAVDDAKIESLIAALENIADDLMVDISQ